jgi:glutamate dehydrogenase
MTTRSVHQFVLGVLEKLNIKEESITKFQTGGPDGDLGCNEITISKDTTKAIVDGSGVLFDPLGLDREELNRLADNRVMVREFNKAKLSPKGYLIDINDKNVTLPDGTVVDDGMTFRNNFHLNPASSADLFVPCGGRPESVNTSNLPQILNADGTCKWKYIVEGANLFCTQGARQELEKLGVELFKDASANKGGVTSSSKEVTAALALSDEEFKEHMVQRADGSFPEFYKAYVQDIITIVEKNARDEFECLWQARKDTGLQLCDLTDKVSLKINSLADGIGASNLWDNKKLREVVFKEALPPTLLKQTGLVNFQKRVPLNYQQAIFSTYLACQFVYKIGYTASEFALFDFLRKYESKAQ